MFRQSPRKNQRSGGMKTKRVLQIGLLLGVFIWLFVHGNDKKDSSQENPKFLDKRQQYENDNVIKFGRKDLKPKRETYNEDEKPMDVQPLERSHFQDNNMGMVKHIENYANNLKETETEEGGVAKVGKDGEMGTLSKVELQESNMGMVEHIDNFADNIKETETEEGGVAKEGKDEEMGTLDGVDKDVIDVERVDNFHKINDKMFDEYNNDEPDAGKDDEEHIESGSASIKMKNMKKHDKSKIDAYINDAKRGEQTMETVHMSKEDTNGEKPVDNDGKGNRYGEIIDGNARKEDKGEGTMEANENGDEKVAKRVESENKLENELGELMEENKSKGSTNNAMKDENEGNGKVSENSQKSAKDEMFMEQKLEGKVSENSQKSVGDEVSIEQKVMQGSDGIKGKGNEKRIGKDKRYGKEVAKNNKVGKHEDVLNEKISLPNGKIIGISNKSSKNIQENNPNAEVASGVTIMASKNGTGTKNGNSNQPENTKSTKKNAKRENNNHIKTLTTGNQNNVLDYEQQLLGSIEKLNTNDEKSSFPSTKVKVEATNNDMNGYSNIESIAVEGQNAKPKISQITTDKSSVEVGLNIEPKTNQDMVDRSSIKVGQNAEPKTYQGTVDKFGVEVGHNAESKTYQDTTDRFNVTQGQKKSSMNEINDSNEHLKLGINAKGDGKMTSFNDDIGTNVDQSRRKKPHDFTSSSVYEINKSNMSHTFTDATKPNKNLTSISENNGSSTQSRIKTLSHVTSSSNEDETPMSHVEGTKILSHDTSSSNEDETPTLNEEDAVVDSREDESSSGSLSQEEKDARTDLDTLPELETSNNDSSE